MKDNSSWYYKTQETERDMDNRIQENIVFEMKYWKRKNRKILLSKINLILLHGDRRN